MTRIVPSQVVLAIDEMFPNLSAGNATGFNFTVGSAGALRCVLGLVGQIPQELLSLSAREYADLALQMGRIELQLQIWINQGGSAADHLSGKNPVYVIREVLKQCPDEYPPASTAELAFIGDPDLRESIRTDIGAATRALQNGEWKAATVLAGAAIEALLHWSLSNPAVTPAQMSAALAALPTQKRPSKNDMDHWNLGHYIDVAAQLTLIEPSTVTDANLAREYRNLIHPGKAKRQSLICDRATAFSAMAGMEHVIRDLK